MADGAVLIAGCGYVGSALAVRLAAAQARPVYALRRSPVPTAPGVTPLQADLCVPASLDVLGDDIELVVYAAATRGPSDDAAADAYVRGPENLMSALARRGARVRRVVFTSSTGVFGGREGAWVDESSATDATDATSRRVLEGERVFGAGPFSATVLRLTGIYGPGRTRLVDDVRDGRARRPAGVQWTNRIHRDDCAGVLQHLLDLPSPPALVIGVDHEPADLADVQTWIAARLGVPAPPPAAEGESVPGLRGGRGSKRCSNALLLATGYRFTAPTYREGYAELIGRD